MAICNLTKIQRHEKTTKHTSCEGHYAPRLENLLRMSGRHQRLIFRGMKHLSSLSLGGRLPPCSTMAEETPLGASIGAFVGPSVGARIEAVVGVSVGEAIGVPVGIAAVGLPQCSEAGLQRFRLLDVAIHSMNVGFRREHAECGLLRRCAAQTTVLRGAVRAPLASPPTFH